MPRRTTRQIMLVYSTVVVTVLACVHCHAEVHDSLMAKTFLFATTIHSHSDDTDTALWPRTRRKRPIGEAQKTVQKQPECGLEARFKIRRRRRIRQDDFLTLLPPFRGGSSNPSSVNSTAEATTTTTAAASASATNEYKNESTTRNIGLFSLFQMNNLLKADMKIVMGQDDDHVDFQKNRGGALVKTLPLPDKRRRGFPRLLAWFAVKEQDTIEETRVSSSLTSSSWYNGIQQSAREQLESVWWNNAWMDQIPALPENTNDYDNNNNDDDDDDDDDEWIWKDEQSLETDENDENDTLTLVPHSTLPTEKDNVKEEGEEGEDDLQSPQDILDVEEEEEESNDDIVIVLEDQDDEEQQDRVQVAAIAEEDRSRQHVHKKKRKRHKRHTNKNKSKEGVLVTETMASEFTSADSPQILESAPLALEEATPQSPNVSLAQDEDFMTLENSTFLSSSKDPSPYTSSGAWAVVDAMLTFGYSLNHPEMSWKFSRSLRPVRKSFAHYTGMHGVLSGKPRLKPSVGDGEEQPELSAQERERRALLQQRLASIDRARGNVARAEARQSTRRPFWRRGSEPYPDEQPFVHNTHVLEQERQKSERLKEIDDLMQRGTQRLAELATEKDLLQNMPNPLFNYSTTYDELDRIRRMQEEELLSTESESDMATNSSVDHTNTTSFEAKLKDYTPIAPKKEFHFPPDDLVDEYLDMLFSGSRLIKLNHTDLWKKNGLSDEETDDEEDEEDDEEWLSTQEKAERKLRRRNRQTSSQNHNYYRNMEQTGSRWLRNGLGEKIGVAVEMVAYKAVCSQVMGFLARSLSAMHGVNVMGHADIFVRADYVPVLPPNLGPSTESYASQAFYNVMTSSTKSKKKKRKRKSSMDSVQRHAVVETLLSHCQVACPLLKLFPLAWQRALLGNMIILTTSVMSDFLEGLEFEILGHRLEVMFKPITEQDMLKRMAREKRNNSYLNQAHPARSHEAFEAAVKATTAEMAENLNFLDKWHERVLGGDSIRIQIAALIARVVLSLVDDILSQSRVDMWSNSVGGPRLVTGLYYRTAQKQ